MGPYPARGRWRYSDRIDAYPARGRCSSSPLCRHPSAARRCYVSMPRGRPWHALDTESAARHGQDGYRSRLCIQKLSLVTRVKPWMQKLSCILYPQFRLTATTCGRVKIADFGLSRHRVEYTMTFCGRCAP
jgi:hypothetical protein